MQKLCDFLKKNIGAHFDKKADFTAYKLKSIHSVASFNSPFSYCTVGTWAVLTTITDERYFFNAGACQRTLHHRVGKY
jgi:hypothetical protein